MREVISQSENRSDVGDIGMFGQRVTEQDIDLTALEKKWEKEGKPARKRSYLRYYYRNRDSILKKQQAKSRNSGYEVEKVDSSRGLIV
jgi:hypothetical protein